MNVKQAWNWLFTNGGSSNFVNWINFNNTTPTVPKVLNITPSKLPNYTPGVSLGNSASMSDTNGNLVFYTNGDSIYDMTGALVATASTGTGTPFAFGAVIAVPHPTIADNYYIFTVGDWNPNCIPNLCSSPANWSTALNGPFDLRYTQINHNTTTNTVTVVPGLFNDVIASAQNGPSVGTCACGEGYAGMLTVIRSSNAAVYYLIAVPTNGYRFDTYKIDGTPLTPAPAVFATSAVVTYAFDGGLRFGQLKPNRLGTKVAFGAGFKGSNQDPNRYTPVLSIYDFDNTVGSPTEGEFSNEQILMFSNVIYNVKDASGLTWKISELQYNSILGLDWSPNGNWLYVSFGCHLQRYSGNASIGANYSVLLQINVSALGTWTFAGTSGSTQNIPSTHAIAKVYPANSFSVSNPTPYSTSLGVVQRGPDNCLYVNNTGTTNVLKLSTPNLSLNSSGFTITNVSVNPIDTGNIITAIGLPMMPNNILPLEDTPANLLLTPCCDIGSPVIVDPANLTNYDPNFSTDYVFCIPGIQDGVNCYEAVRTFDAVTDATSYTVQGQFRNCAACKNSGPECNDCNFFYFNLLDCCTNEPYKNELGEIVYFKYYNVTDYLGQPVPSDFASPIIITEIKNEATDVVAEGCLILNELAGFDPNITYLDWVTEFYTATSVAKCSDCQICKTCYVLEDCRNPANIIYTDTDLSLYVGQTVVLLGDTGTCYFVDVLEECTGTEVSVTILKSFATCWDCNPCYKLVDCENPANFIYSDQDSLSAYINPTKIIKVNGGATCYIVQKSDVCTGPFTYVTVNNEFEQCAECKGCFKLTNCEDDTDVEYVIDPQLTQYLGQVIVLKFGTKCYKVSYDKNCEGDEVTLQIGQSFQDTATQTACEQCIPAPKPPKLTNERPVRPGYIKPKCPNNCDTGCSSCNNNC